MTSNCRISNAVSATLFAVMLMSRNRFGTPARI